MMVASLPLCCCLIITVLATPVGSGHSDGVCRFGRALNGLPTSEADAIQCATDVDCPYGYSCTVAAYANLATITVCCPRMAVWKWLPPPSSSDDTTLATVSPSPATAPAVVWQLKICEFGTPLGKAPTCEQEAIQCSTNADCPHDYHCTVGGPYLQLNTIAMCCPNQPPPTHDLVPKRQPSFSNVNICPFGEPLGRTPTSEEDAIQCSTNADCPRDHSCTIGGPWRRLNTIALCCPNPPKLTTAVRPPQRANSGRWSYERCLAQPSNSPCWQSGRARIGWYFNATTQTCAAYVYSHCQLLTAKPFKTRVECETCCLWPRQQELEVELQPLTTSAAAPTPLCPRTITSPNEHAGSCPPDNAEPTWKQETADINYFQEPMSGFGSCPHQTPCSMASPCNSGGFCPPYPQAKCIQSWCHGCLAEFHVNGRRVNCSSSTKADQKAGRCPRTGDGFVVCDPQFYAERPEPVLCSADVECPLSQKCCPDPCYHGVHKTCHWPVL